MDKMLNPALVSGPIWQWKFWVEDRKYLMSMPKHPLHPFIPVTVLFGVNICFYIGYVIPKVEECDRPEVQQTGKYIPFKTLTVVDVSNAKVSCFASLYSLHHCSLGSLWHTNWRDSFSALRSIFTPDDMRVGFKRDLNSSSYMYFRTNLLFAFLELHHKVSNAPNRLSHLHSLCPQLKDFICC